MTVAGLRRRRNTRIVPDGDLGLNYDNPDETPLSPYFQAVMADGPDVYYRLDETGSGPFVDIKNAHNLTPNTTIVTASSLLTADPDAAATFDYSSGLASADIAYDLTQTTTTIEYWVKPISLTAGGAQLYNQAIGCVTATGTRGWNTGYRTNGVWSFTLAGVATYEFTTATPIATVGVTNHVVVVLVGTAASLYIDGAFKQTITIGAMLTGTGPGVHISGYTGLGANYQIRATIDELAIYKSALTYAQIRAHYDASLYGRYGAAAERVVRRAWAGRS